MPIFQINHNHVNTGSLAYSKSNFPSFFEYQCETRLAFTLRLQVYLAGFPRFVQSFQREIVLKKHNRSICFLAEELSLLFTKE